MKYLLTVLILLFLNALIIGIFAALVWAITQLGG